MLYAGLGLGVVLYDVCRFRVSDVCSMQVWGKCCMLYAGLGLVLYALFRVRVKVRVSVVCFIQG